MHTCTPSHTCSTCSMNRLTSFSCFCMQHLQHEQAAPEMHTCKPSHTCSIHPLCMQQAAPEMLGYGIDQSAQLSSSLARAAAGKHTFLGGGGHVCVRLCACVCVGGRGKERAPDERFIASVVDNIMIYSLRDTHTHRSTHTHPTPPTCREHGRACNSGCAKPRRLGAPGALGCCAAT